jgi:hypothetical protein
MPKKSSVPAYRLHRASGQAVVTLNGVDHYLGRWNSPESKAEYDRLISEWLIGGRRLAQSIDRMLVKKLVLGYDRHMRATASEAKLERIRAALKPVRQLYGNTAAKFGPVAYKAVRSRMIEAGLCISTIRQRMGVIRRMVAWGVES